MFETAIRNPINRPLAIAGLTGLISGIVMAVTPMSVQAMNLIPLNGFTYDLPTTPINPDVNISHGQMSLLTTGSAFATSGGSVTVTGGSLLNVAVPVGGAGYLYEATGAGSITFDWQFTTTNPESFFGFAQFNNRTHLTNTLNNFVALLGTLSPGTPVPESFYDSFTYALLQDGATGSGQYTVNFAAGNIFGFGVALEGLDARLYANNNLNLGSFTFTPRVSTSTAPQNVPTPAAVLPIITGLFAAAKRRKQLSGIREQ